MRTVAGPAGTRRTRIGGCGLSTAARLLKERTADIHQRVDTGLALVGPQVDLARLVVVVDRLRGFWAGTEPLLDDWAAAHPEAADRVQWQRRRRAGRLERDAAALAVAVQERSPAAPPSAPAVFDSVDEACLLGWLYVAEGSTLGGAVIERSLRANVGAGHVPLETFTPYDEGPGPMWRSYLAALAGFAADELRTMQVVNAGAATFGALEAWLAAVYTPVAA